MFALSALDNKELFEKFRLIYLHCLHPHSLNCWKVFPHADCMNVMDEPSTTTVSSCFKCLSDLLGNEEVIDTWNTMEQFISLFLTFYS